MHHVVSCLCFSHFTCQCLIQSLVCVSVVLPANVSLSLSFVFQSFYLPMSHSVPRLCFSRSTCQCLTQSLVCVSVVLPANVSLSLSFVFQSFYLPMTLDNMNKLRFSPKKDYNANRLSSGLLQLSENTHLVLDETALQPGQLDTNGQSLTLANSPKGVISYSKSKEKIYYR